MHKFATFDYCGRGTMHLFTFYVCTQVCAHRCVHTGVCTLAVSTLCRCNVMLTSDALLLQSDPALVTPDRTYVVSGIAQLLVKHDIKITRFL